MTKLSVVIITYNEEKNIERCLESVKMVADEIVVVDSFSEDATAEICATYNTIFVQKIWKGYSETKNIGNSIAANDWILSLDADEALSPELQQAIQDLKNSNNIQTAKFNRLTNYCGKWIKYGSWYPDTKIRLFNKHEAKWEGEIHERLMFKPKEQAVLLKGDCLHYSYYTLNDHYNQVEKYTSLAAQDLFNKGFHPSILHLYLSPIFKFFKEYILLLGFLNGNVGYTIAHISAYAVMLKYKKLKGLFTAQQQL